MNANGELKYLTGFGNEHATEALSGALPEGMNSPQRAPYGLYAEVHSGTAFTAPRALNQRTWFYRIRPSVALLSSAYALENSHMSTAPGNDVIVPMMPMRWSPLDVPDTAIDFLSGWRTMLVNGSAASQNGVAVHVYICNASMTDRYFRNTDGELLVVPQQGRLRCRTEAGVIDVSPGEICVIPRAFIFTVDVLDGASRGYICENYGAQLQLPELGPIGSNSLAHPRHFQYPVAAYEDSDRSAELVMKASGQLTACEIDHSPLDVVAWHGSCAPYKYDLKLFNTIGTVSFDHPDPSIYTVLTSPSDTAGVANVDFVIFPPRWLVAEDTFRPPWYHRNVMSEFMGLIYGVYDGKPDGFMPGGSSLHNCMIPHGPDSAAFERGSYNELGPEKLDETMAFMFESRYPYMVTDFAMKSGLQEDYIDCWRGLRSHFNPQARE
jgi:homogentisate 1,2-dioxygenase